MSVCVNIVRPPDEMGKQPTDMTVRELLALCEARGIKPPSRRKADLIAALS